MEAGGDVLANANWDVLLNFDMISKVKSTNYGLYLTGLLILIIAFAFRKARKLDRIYGYSDRRLIKLFFHNLPEEEAKRSKPPNPMAKIFVIVYSAVVTYDWEFERKKKEDAKNAQRKELGATARLVKAAGKRKMFSKYVECLEDYRSLVHKYKEGVSIRNTTDSPLLVWARFESPPRASVSLLEMCRQ